MNSIVVFFSSMGLALLMLGIERFAGIGWDFHPDSVTYATLAGDTVRSILAENYFLIFNNGYYFWANFLGMSIFLMTGFNIVLFSATNVILFRFHERHCTHIRGGKWIFALAMIMLNPYRLHLSTTALKDTMILFFVVLSAVNNIRALIWIAPALITLRIASIFYFVTKMKRKYLIYFLVISLIAAVISANALADRLLEFNAADMQLREFDRIPTFRDYGLIGIVVRGLLWPILAVTGVFAVISPALAFFPVAIGSVMNQVYCYVATRKFALPLNIFVPMVIFGALVTGYTAYVRYVYPLMVILPILAVRQRVKEQKPAAGHSIPIFSRPF